MDTSSWLDSLVSSWNDTGNTTVGNSPIALSTPVNTSANPNNSGSFFSSLISGLTGLGSSALNAYNQYTGTAATTTAAQTQATAAASTASMVKMLVIGGIALAGLFLLVSIFRKK